MSQVQRTRVTSGTVVWDKYEQVFYVAKGGSDTNDGKNLQTPKLTIGSALTAAAAETPGAANRFAIVCFDDGIYTESITCQEYCDIFFPNAKLVGNIVAADNCSIKFREQECVTDSNGIQYEGTEYLNVDIDIVTTFDCYIWLYINDGTNSARVNVKFKTLYVPVDSYGIYQYSGAAIHIEGGEIYITGTGATGIRINDGPATGHIGYVYGDGAQSSIFWVNGESESCMTLNRISNVETALDIRGGEAYFFVNYISGDYGYNIDAGAELYLVCHEINVGLNTVNAAGVINQIEADKGILTSDSLFYLDTPFASTNSPALSFRGDNAGTELEGSIYLAQAADPYLRISVDDDAATPTLTEVVDIYDDALLFPNDNTVDIGASGATRPKDYYGAGDVTAAGTGTFQDVVVTSQTEHAVTIYGSGGELTEVGPLTNGQVVIGSTGNAPVAATLTAGANVTITEGAGTITVAAAAGGGGVISWVEVTTTSQSADVDTGYITNNANLVTVTLPSTIAVGEVVRISGKGAGMWRVAQNAGQTIYFGNQSTTTGAGGRLDATHRRDAIELVCVTANSDFNVISSIGNITVT